MMSLLRQKRPLSREKRHNALSAYVGDVNRLLENLRQEENSQRIRTFSQAAFDEIIHVLTLVSAIDDAVIVINGPRGCGAALLYFDANSETGGRWAVTNLNERDTIMGGDAKLRETVLAVYQRYRPRVIFVVATPVVSINNDDLQTVVEELTEELNIQIVPIYADGFKSRTGVTGFDLVMHALVKYLIPENQGVKDDVLNLIAVTENRQDLGEIQRLLEALGLKVNTLPRSANLQSLTQAARAKLSVSINPDFSDYLGKALEEKLHIPFLQPPLPVGIAGTQAWLTAIGTVLNLEKEVADLHARESRALDPLLEKRSLRNKRVYISLPASAALGTAGLVEELGGEVAGITVQYVDKLHEKKLTELAAKKPELRLHVAQGQPFEEANILNRLKPDLYIGIAGLAVWAAKTGIPAVSAENAGILGYRGISRLISCVDKALQNKFYVEKLAKHTASPYHNNWYQRSPDWYIKLEVR